MLQKQGTEAKTDLKIEQCWMNLLLYGHKLVAHFDKGLVIYFRASPNLCKHERSMKLTGGKKK